MKIIYISSFVSDKLFNDLVSQSLTTGYVGQKYHGMFIRGLVKNLGDNNVVALSQPPINKRFCKLKEAEDGIKIRYVPIIPIPIIKQTIYFIYSFFYALYWGLRNIHEDKVIICSIMRIYQYIPIRIASLFFGKCKKITVACDVPWMTTIQVSGSKSKLSPKVRLAIWMSKKMCASFDMYIVLTEEMSKVLNPYNKPYIVVEGFCDVRMNDIQNHLTDKYEKDIVIYAGGLNKEYGILELVQAVRSIENENLELWLYGTGDVSSQLACISNIDKKIKYYGPRNNSEIVNSEIKAMLLVNPRPTSREYTHYSFPSKTMEYMASGTYTLTTRLAGIPSEYFNYCGCIEDYSAEGIALAINNALRLGREELHAKGLHAKKFVLAEKNNIIQTQKVITFINQH